MNKKTTIKVYKIINLIIVFLFLVILGKLCFITLAPKVDGINLKEKSASIVTINKALPASRGSIYSASGDTLATTINSYTLIAYLSPKRTTDLDNPQHVVDKKLTASKLAPILNMDEQTILNYLNKDAYQVEFGSKAKNLTDITKQKIDKLALPGLDFITTTKRYYSMSTFASYIVGYAKLNKDNKIKGELGIEKFYDDILAGKDGTTKYQKYTSSNYQIPNTPSQTTPAINGADIYLTIDSNIQLIAEKAINEYEKYNPEWAVLAVMDANTGAILASATSPNFNPNDTNTIKKWLNPLISIPYEPGSVMKIFSFATAINENKYNGSKTYKSGQIIVADKIIRDANRTGWGEINYDTGFAYSSNVAASKLALEVGTAKLTDYYNNLGFGSPTGIELANEEKGIININNQVTLVNASFGQGINVTPIQLLKAATTITNDGKLLKPYIVDKIIDSKGQELYHGQKNIISQVYKKETIKKMQSLMKKVIYEGLTNRWQVEGIELMGKTGTAQIPSPKGGYLAGKYNTIKSFLAIFPTDKPKYITYVAVKKLETPAKNFANIITNAIKEIAGYAKLLKSDKPTEENKLFYVNNYISKKTIDVKNEIANKSISPIIIGNGNYVIDQYPLKNNILPYEGKLFIVTNDNNYTMPNLVGWSRNEVDTYCKLCDLKCNFTGYGYVLNQNIAHEEIINQDTILEITLE